MRKAVGLAVCCALVAAAAASAATPTLTQLLIQPSKVGKGYGVYRRTDGFGLKTRTLDLCGTQNYPSEKLRTGRLQVNYLKPNAQLGLSLEIVSYKPGGAVQAMREVTRHALTCPSHAISPGEQNLPPLLFRITRISDPHLVKGYLAVRVHVTGTVKGKKVDDTSFAVYQRQGDLLTGVYSFGGGAYSAGRKISAQQAFCLHAAEQSARLLRSVGSGGPTA